MTLRIIAGKFKGRTLKTAKSSTRPTQGVVREAVFNICQNEIAGALFLDLFAGSGAMGFEAISRGAAQATLVEQDRMAIRCIRENMKLLQVENEILLIPSSVSSALNSLMNQKRVFDLIYVDPPYDGFFDLSRIFKLISSRGILFFEQRSSSKPIELPKMRLEETRRFGSSSLNIFKVEH